MTGVMASCALISFSIVIIGGRIITRKPSIEATQEESAEMAITS
jgi:hypothetical protein